MKNEGHCKKIVGYIVIEFSIRKAGKLVSKHKLIAKFTNE